MRTVFLASMRIYARRYAAAICAIVLAVAFIVVTNALTSATKDGLYRGIDQPFRTAVGVIDRPSNKVAEKYATRGGWPMAGSMQAVRTSDRLLGSQVLVNTVATEKRWQWQHLVSGRFPTTADETVVDVNYAKANRIKVGDRLRLGTGSGGFEATVVGTVDAPAMWAAKAYVTWPRLQAWDRWRTSAVLLADHGDPADHVVTSDRFLTDVQRDLNRQIDVVAYMFLVFAAIALFVSVMVIANTFSILFAQRLRDFALLRCLGATRRQVLRSVRREALVLGIVSSLVGLAVGALLGTGIVALIREFASNAPLGDVVLDWPWLVSGLVAGVLTTLVASWLPTRSVLRVSPLAALRPQEGVTRSVGRRRIGLGVAVVLLGAGTTTVSVAADDLPQLPLMLLGGGVTFLGVLVLGPVLVPFLIRVAGAALAPVVGSPARLAAANAGRNPRRTAATAASLLVGVTLTTGVLTGMATIRGAVVGQEANQRPLDIAMESDKPLAPSVLTATLATRGVADAIGVAGAVPQVRVDGHSVGLPVLAPPDTDIPLRHLDIAPGTIVLNEALAAKVTGDSAPPAKAGDAVTLALGRRTSRLHVVIRPGYDTALVAPETLRSLAPSAGTYAIWVKAEKGADADDLGGDLGAVAPDAIVANGLQARAWVDLQLDIFTWSVVGLLGISILIALAGIANTLGLSVLERAREHALLRALGLTRRQLRRVLAAEAVLLASVAAVMGTVLGVVFAWAGVQVLIGAAIPDVSLVVPAWQLAAVIVVAGLAGLLACVAPARRAARVSPAAGLALE